MPTPAPCQNDICNVTTATKPTVTWSLTAVHTLFPPSALLLAHCAPETPATLPILYSHRRAFALTVSSSCHLIYPGKKHCLFELHAEFLFKYHFMKEGLPFSSSLK
jgi:hypothetical protein